VYVYIYIYIYIYEFIVRIQKYLVKLVLGRGCYY
jgi:hypothetical protein